MVGVLIVEDNREIAELQAFALRDYATVELITDHFQRALRPETWLGVDVAVIDLMLPGLEGETIVSYLASNHAQIKRVICTAKPMSQLVDLQQYAHVILQKPFGIDSFISAVVGSDVRRSD